MATVYDYTVRDAAGGPVDMAAYKGKVVLVVNVASKCGFTPQYKGLEALYRKYKDQGLVILGFPCNQFGQQEPGDAQEIQNFCSLTYDVTFPVLAKVEVNGDKAEPLYEHLKARARGFLGSKSIKWNFTKFLVGKDGKVKRYAPLAKPEQLEKAIQAALGA
ncbi:glutathione peroxidase [Nitrospirillum viridazoti]|uniref:Glutathione peroxidase n=2 Tax=Nitrospirillum TaxID=1543705 RepID=A0A248JYY9_9PROT|nr:glutathione peroxidase [Nitrospirillum amazonense]ASG23368.1 glutathione peroxidase [Nitrospirillum amazonense CBAmc]EGX99894.1 glutathione peroxidase [Nitrospirillum amazonense Y2]TWB39953.1 glutathione peroxidase [Nitrospirillum amazonense]TWB51140.1 glutathione peroxidase [Nitrospirillum amazonense]